VFPYLPVEHAVEQEDKEALEGGERQFMAGCDLHSPNTATLGIWWHLVARQGMELIARTSWLVQPGDAQCPHQASPPRNQGLLLSQAQESQKPTRRQGSSSSRVVRSPSQATASWAIQSSQ
jgi:hypothetical protein